MWDGAANQNARHDCISERQRVVGEVEVPFLVATPDGAVSLALEDHLEAPQAELYSRDDAEEGRDDGEDEADSQCCAKQESVV